MLTIKRRVQCLRGERNTYGFTVTQHLENNNTRYTLKYICQKDLAHASMPL